MASSRKRIFICCASYPPEIGGAPGRIYNLAHLLRAAGYAVTVFSSMPNYPKGKIFPAYRGRFYHKEVMEGIEVRRLWLIPSNAPGIWARGFSLLTQCLGILLGAARTIIFAKADAVYVSSPPLISAYLFALLARLGRKKLLVNISDIWPLTARELGALKEGKMLRLLHKAERYLYKHAAVISGQSPSILSHVKEEQAADTKQPLFLHLNLPVARDTQKTTGGPAASRQVIYAGALGFAQGLYDICKGVDFPSVNIGLDIYGDGVERAQIERYISEHPGCGIRLHMPVAVAELQRMLTNYDAMLIPLRSPIRGAVPSKLFTAINAGLPVLYCAGGDGEIWVKEHKLGWAAPPADMPALRYNLSLLAGLSPTELTAFKNHVLLQAADRFNKAAQDTAFQSLLKSLLG